MENKIKALRAKEENARKRKKAAVKECISCIKEDWYADAAQYLMRASQYFAEQHICANMASELQREVNAEKRTQGTKKSERRFNCSFVHECCKCSPFASGCLYSRDFIELHKNAFYDCGLFQYSSHGKEVLEIADNHTKLAYVTFERKDESEVD